VQLLAISRKLMKLRIPGLCKEQAMKYGPPFSLERALDECESLVDDVAANYRIQGLSFQFMAKERRVVAQAL